MCRFGKSTGFVAVPVWLMSVCLMAVACDKPGGGGSGTGILSLRFSEETLPQARAVVEKMDTNAFLLTLENQYGGKIYEGTYGNMPEYFEVEEGAYVVRAVSREFARPAFSSPQFGDEKCLVVHGGARVSTVLDCRQLNVGVKLETDVSFLENYPSSSLLLRHRDGSLPYSYREKRFAYFRPGEVSLVLVSGSEERKLLSRQLKASEMLVLSVSASGGAETQKTGIRLRVDTTRVWRSEDYVIDGTCPGGEDSGTDNTPENAMTVATALKNVGMSDVWINGFIVGGDLSSSSFRETPPFESETNLLLAPRAGKCLRESCIAVNLPAGKVRDALNLVDNPVLLGRQVCLKGDIVEKYFGQIGLKNVKDFQM